MKKNPIIYIFLMLFLLSFLFCSKSESQKEKPWQWSLEQIKSKVSKVRAGKDLIPETWPDGAKVAVAVYVKSGIKE